MDGVRSPDVDFAIDVPFAPQLHHTAIPVEVLDWSDLMTRMVRMPGHQVHRRHRARFHQLIVCTEGHGSHRVDFQSVALSVGTLARIRPGQVQQFEPEPAFEAQMVIWSAESQPHDPAGPVWYPGSATPSTWNLARVERERVLGWVGELRYQQERFDGGQRRADMMRAVLHALLLGIEVELEGDPAIAPGLPRPYLDLRERLEQDLHRRPTAASLARTIGYSTRTLDRACREASGLTAKQVIDERIALELRRHLADASRTISQVRIDLGYDDSSNFTKLVHRHLGMSPAEFRSRLDQPQTS